MGRTSKKSFNSLEFRAIYNNNLYHQSTKGWKRERKNHAFSALDDFLSDSSFLVSVYGRYWLDFLWKFGLVRFTNYIITIFNIIYNRGLYRLVNITYRVNVKKFLRFLNHKFGVIIEFCSNLASKVVAGRLWFIKEKMGQAAAVRWAETRQRQDNAPCLRMNFCPLMFASGLIVSKPYLAKS